MARLLGTVIPTEEDTKSWSVIVSGNGTGTIAYLNALRAAAVSPLNALCNDLQTLTGLASQTNQKQAMTAIQKVARPETQSRYAGFGLEHLRDYLRFRTPLRQAADFVDVLSYFVARQSAGDISIVKLDGVKIEQPGGFGWRMFATDLRILPDGMLVEHYMTFSTLIDANEEWLHGLYENWRGRNMNSMTLGQLAKRDEDMKVSTAVYAGLFARASFMSLSMATEEAAMGKLEAQAAANVAKKWV